MNAAAERATVSVIVPTTALSARRALIWRAIHSILDQAGVYAVPTVVINGPARDPDLTRELMADTRLRVHVLESAGLAHALQTGRRLVDAPWFGELDDDDILLPGALARRVGTLEQNAGYDCVVTNGLRRHHGEDTANISDMDVVERDPIGTFFDWNWLLPGSYLCRTDRVGVDLFDGMPEALECTYIALRLATSYRIKFLQCSTVIWNEHTPGSLSKSREWILAHARALNRILELDLPPHARRKVRERITWDCHSVSDLYLHERNLTDAWWWHLRSLNRPGGHQYLLYTRKLLWAMLAPRRIRR